ncbi:MAG: hypothetical protein H6656_20190 [Ardenticatenaceae bacterium]|nr:hypothetical protein [Anaerolineales bacterium]MCB9009651.1 hypothetical protein [Ardenticatenaceae bacterium]
MTFMPQSNSRKWLWLTLLATAVIVSIVQIPLLFQPEYVDEDLRFFYWLFRLADHSLFENDPLLGYQIAELNLGFATILINKVSLLYGMLYTLLSSFMSPFVFSKILIFPLALIGAYYLYQITSQFTAPLVACLISSIYTLIVAVPYSAMTLSSGLPRSFTLPLLVAMLYYMGNDNHLGMVVVLILGLFYPPLFLTILLTYGVKYLYEFWQHRRLTLSGKQLAMFAAALLVSVLLLLPAIFTGLNTVPIAEDEVQATQETTVFTSPLFGPEGRYPLLDPSPLTGNGGILDNGLIGLYSLGFIAALIPIALILRRKFNNLPLPFWQLALAGVIGFVISWLAILFTPSATFHMPSRYVRGSIFLMGLIFFMINGPLAIQVGSRFLANNRSKLDVILLPIGIVGFVVVYLADVSEVLTAVVGLMIVAVGILLFISRRRSSSETTQVTAPANPETLKSTSDNTSSGMLAVLFAMVLIIPLILYSQGPSTFIRPQQDNAELINFIKSLPQDVLIAGYPCLLDDVPLYSQHAVLFSCETESRDMGMMMKALDAYFAEAEEDVLAFCREYNVDYLVASEENYTDAFISQEHIIFEPLNSFLKQQLEGRDTFVIKQITDDRRVFQNSSFFVFPCSAETFVPDA